MTNHWVDIKNADVVLIMGGNAAEAHPCGFKWVIEAKQHNKAKLVVVDPRFTRSAAMSDYYAPIRAGSDIAFLGGVINYLSRATTRSRHEYVRNYTNAPFIVGDDYKFEDGLFSGYDDDKRSYDPKSWGYEMGDDGFAKVDMTMEAPALRAAGHEAPLRALHARDGEPDHRHAEGQVPEGLRVHRLDRGAGRGR